MNPGSKNVINKPLVEPSKVLLSPFHIKFGLKKQFVKALNKEGRSYISRKYKSQIPGNIECKIEGRNF